MDLEQIKSTIKEARPNISENSLKVYSTNVKKVIGNNDVKILKNKQHILDFLQGKSASTKRNYLNAILIFLKINESKTNKKLIRELETMRDTEQDKYINSNEDGRISDVQKENLVEWTEILKVVDSVTKLVRDKNLLKKKSEDFKKPEYILLQTYILLNLYTKLPPLRNDYSGMKVLSKQQFKDLKISERERGNWLVTDLKTYMKIYINNFKTQGVYDEIIIDTKDIPKELRLILNKFIVQFNLKNDYLFKIFNTEKKTTRQQITMLLTNIFKKILKKNISTTLIRKS
eukprot:COSAG01_NODE_202_length_22130_cov_167.927239_16_plen_288_part_00